VLSLLAIKGVQFSTFISLADFLLFSFFLFLLGYIPVGISILPVHRLTSRVKCSPVPVFGLQQLMFLFSPALGAL
jgi:hypothetical protein